MAEAKQNKDGDNAKLKFYGNKNSTASQRVWTALEYYGIEYEFVNCTIAGPKEDYFKKAYSLALGKQENNTGKVPIIYHNGKYIAESTIIIRYLDAVYASHSEIPSLFPEDIYERMCVESITEWFLKQWAPLHFGLLFESDEIKYAEKGQGFKKMLKLFNNRLSGLSDIGLFLKDKDDKKLSYLEVLCIPYLDRLIILEKLCNLPITEWIEKDKDLERLKSFYSALKEIKSIQTCSTIKDETLDFYIDYYTKVRAKWKSVENIDTILYRF